MLFTFPSRYLSAIGLAPVFSLGWSLPPDLGCIPKQPDSTSRSSRPVAPGFSALRGSHPLRHAVPSRLRARRNATSGQLRSPDHNSPVAQWIRPEISDLGTDLFPLHSPLLRESLLVSLPPLIDMFKFSGWISLDLRPQKTAGVPSHRRPSGASLTASTLRRGRGKRDNRQHDTGGPNATLGSTRPRQTDKNGPQPNVPRRRAGGAQCAFDNSMIH